MRPIDSSYDRATAEQRSADPGPGIYALVSDHNGPCSLVGSYDSLESAIEAAREMDTDAAPTDLEDEIDYDGCRDCDSRGLIVAAEHEGWRIVASAPAGEYWTVMAGLLGPLKRDELSGMIGPKPEIHAIRGFEGNYRWLSNFIGAPNEPTVEHRYQAAKAIDRAEAESVLATPTAAAAKKMGRTITVRPDWDAVKLETMRQLLQDKFSREPFRSKLISTGEAEIIEENHWNDTFWGVCKGVGENHLGRLLMDLRREIQSQ